MPYFTIVIPVYRAQKYIKECLNSIRNQTYKDFEVILVDDGSPDECPKICDEYVQDDSRFLVIHKKNEGSQKARKVGVQKARGRYVAFVDADDWVDSEWLEYAFNQLEQYQTDILIFGYKQEFAHKTVKFKNKALSGLYKEDKLYKEIYPYILSSKEFFEFKIWPSLWSKIFKRELILQTIELVDEKLTLGEDAACTYVSVRKSQSIYICNDAFYHYRYVSDSLAQKYDPHFWENAERLFDFFDKVQEKNAEEQLLLYKMYILLLGIRKEFLYSSRLNESRRTIEKICKTEKFKTVIQQFECNKIQQTDRFIISILKQQNYGKLQRYFYVQKRKNRIKTVLRGIWTWKKRKGKIS